MLLGVNISDVFSTSNRSGIAPVVPTEVEEVILASDQPASNLCHVPSKNECCVVYSMSPKAESHDVTCPVGSHLVGSVTLLVCAHSTDLLVSELESQARRTLNGVISK